MANSQVREEFSKRLKKAFQDKGISIDSPTWLAREFNENYAGKRVSQQTVRKWLNGESIPTHDKIKTLAQWLGVSPHELHYGEEGGAGHAAQQPAAPYRSALPDLELIRRYRKLNVRQQQAVAEIITALAAKDRRR